MQTIAETRANILYDLNIKISSLQQGSRRSNIEIGIACLDIGLTMFTREAYSEDWANVSKSSRYCLLFQNQGRQGREYRKGDIIF
jgi:hypothetical protein